MQRVADLTTRLVTPGSDTEAPTSEIVSAGVSTGKRVTGAVLEAAIGWRDCTLLFMIDDVPLEEALGIHLLDCDLSVVDSAWLGGPYTTGSFSALELIEPDTVGFRFIGDTRWTVELWPRARFRVPLLGDAPGVRRRLGFSRHFAVRGNPLPQRR